MKPYAAYAVGAALVDTEIQVTDEVLAAINVEKGMMTLVDEARQAEIIGHLSNDLIRARHASGGSAGNSMIATALMGAPTYMSCKVANDSDGNIYLADLEQSGVTHGLNDQRQEGVTGKCVVLITPDAERSLNTHLGISESLSTDEVDEEAIRNSEWVYLEGYLVTSPTGHAAALKTKALAEQHNVRTAVSFSDPGMVKFFRDNMTAMVEGGVELVFCNEAEALEWGQCASLDAAVDAIKKVARRFVITLSGKGALTWDGRTLHQVAARSVTAVNTNGAGDMFAGAFLYALSRGESDLRATEFATLAAGEVVKYFGPRLDQDACLTLRHQFFGD
ncbi:MAG: adenosine kinase [Luminiphilus sp.]|nr:adenosine kinase [Luminiphilus sp.]